MVSRCFLETTKEVMCPMRQASKTSAASSSARWKQPDSAFVFFCFRVMICEKEMEMDIYWVVAYFLFSTLLAIQFD